MLLLLPAGSCCCCCSSNAAGAPAAAATGRALPRREGCCCPAADVTGTVLLVNTPRGVGRACCYLFVSNAIKIKICEHKDLFGGVWSGAGGVVGLLERMWVGGYEG